MFTCGPPMWGGNSDPFYNYVKLLMRFNGNVTDEIGHGMTAAGAPGISYVADWASAGQAVSINAGTDVVYLTTDSTDFAAQGACCIEANVKPAAGDIGGANKGVLVVKQGTLDILSIHSNVGGGNTEFIALVASSGVSNTSMGVNLAPYLSADTEYHISLTRDAIGDYRFFVNGALIATNSSNRGYTPPLATTKVNLGASTSGGAGSFAGKISWVRYTNGAARYTSAFTPPAKP